MASHDRLYSVCKQDAYTSCVIAGWIWKIGCFVLLILGTCGNILNVAILSRRKLRKYSTTVYLMFLAIADLVSLWTSTLEKIMLFVWKTDLNSLSVFHCKTYEWLFETSASFSVWLLAMLTIKRVVYTSFPVHAKMRMTRKFAALASLVLLLFIAMFLTHFVYGYDIRSISTPWNKTHVITTQACIEISGTYRRVLVQYLGPVGVTLFVGVPLSILIVGNGSIITSIWRQNRKVRPNLPGHGDRNFRKNLRNIKTTRLLFTVCGFFMICVIPYGIFSLVYLTTQNTWTEGQFANAHLVFAVLTVLVISNFTFNFLLYSYGGSLFKKELLTVLNAVTTGMRRILVPRRTRTSPDTSPRS